MAMPELHDVTLELGGKHILNGLNAEFWGGHVHALIGPNGAGKSTLANLIMGLPGYTDFEGDILYEGVSMHGVSVDERARRGITLAWQEPARFEGLRRTSSPPRQRQEPGEDREVLHQVGLEPGRYLTRCVDKTLSGGERKRIELASILAMEPKLVLMDEPDSGIDVEALDRIFDVLSDFKRMGTTVIMITHSMTVLEHAEHAFLRCNGRIVDKGVVDKIQWLLRRPLHPLRPRERAGSGREMMPVRVDAATARALLESLGDFGAHFTGDDVAHLEVSGNEVVGAHLGSGARCRRYTARRRHRGAHPPARGRRGSPTRCTCASACCPPTGLQHIVMKVDVEADSFASVRAHCTFPNAIDITHKMDAVVNIAAGAAYEYFERHLHGANGGVLVVPKTLVHIGEGARFRTEFELVKGRAGVIDFDYEADCDAGSTLEMITRIISRAAMTR